MVGYLHDPTKLAAHVTASNISSILYLTGTGAQKAASTLVGAAVGRQDGTEARLVMGATLKWNIALCALMGTLVLTMRHPLAAAYNPGNPGVQTVMANLAAFLVAQ